MAAREEQPCHPLQAGAAAKGSEPERRRESLTGVFFHPQGLGKAAMLSVSKPRNLIKKRQIFSHVSLLLILDCLICVLSGASYFTATMEY